METTTVCPWALDYIVPIYFFKIESNPCILKMHGFMQSKGSFVYNLKYHIANFCILKYKYYIICLSLVTQDIL